MVDRHCGAMANHGPQLRPACARRSRSEDRIVKKKAAKGAAAAAGGQEADRFRWRKTCFPFLSYGVISNEG